MRTAGLLPLTLAGILLAGCASSYTWRLPARPTYGSFEADHGGCIDTANADWSVPALFGGGIAIRKASYVRCMERLGYTKLHDGPRLPDDDLATTVESGVAPR